MKNYSDQEVLVFLNQQEANFTKTSKGSGYNAQEARNQLAKIARLSKEERLQSGREQLQFMDNLQMKTA